MTEPNEFDELRRHREIQERRRRITVRVLNTLTALVLLAIVAFILLAAVLAFRALSSARRSNGEITDCSHKLPMVSSNVSLRPGLDSNQLSSRSATLILNPGPRLHSEAHAGHTGACVSGSRQTSTPTRRAPSRKTAFDVAALSEI